MTYKCKICGGQTTVDAQNGIAICEYCGTKQALPLFTDDSERMLYERGNNYLSHSEYDKAENVFSQLLTIKPNAAELYWDLVLCKYGVTYVKDPASGKYIPTCNRTHYTPIFSDENYKKATELSSGEKKALFEDDAKIIDNIQKGIIAVSKKEKPFDIFISYKETDANGNRTKDSIEAQKLYEKLTEAGYKVFFSRITLEDKVGTEYEPYIYAALYSSKVMLTICSSKDIIDAVWVKNEWSRFLGFRQNDNSKTLLPLYFDMDKADLPEEFALLSAYDMSADGFTEELLRGIKKLIPLPILKAQKRKQMTKTLGISATFLCAVVVVLTAIFLPGYIKDKKHQEAYLNAQSLFGNAKYEEAAKEFEHLGDYKDSKTMLEKCIIQPDYDAAMQLYHNGAYAQAMWKFETLGDYEDAVEKKRESELSWRKSLAKVVYDSFGDIMADYMGNICEAARYGAYVDDNGNINSFYSKSIDTENEVSQLHGKVCDYLGLYDDGYFEKNNNVIQVVTYNLYLTSDGTVHYSSNNEYTTDNYGWEKAVNDWKNITKLYYYEHSDTEILFGVKADGTVELAGYIGNPSNSIDTNAFSSISNVKDIAVGAMGTQYNGPDYFSVAILTSEDTCLQYYLYNSGEFEFKKEIKDLPEKTSSISITASLNSVNILTTSGDLYQFDIDSASRKNYIQNKNFVFLNSHMAISKDGKHYLFDFSSLYDYPERCLPEGISPRIYDEWTKGLN